jgi:dual specificity protein phosphatase 1B
MKSVTQTWPVQWVINRARSIYYPWIYKKFEANEIMEGLWLGSLETACDKKGLNEHGITHIVCAIYDINPQFPESDFTYHMVPVIDKPSAEISEYFNECFNFIDDSIKDKKTVLVHCAFGVSRSSTLVCAYLIKKHDLTVSQAIFLVKSKRPQADPNSGFLKQLVEMSK